MSQVRCRVFCPGPGAPEEIRNVVESAAQRHRVELVYGSVSAGMEISLEFTAPADAVDFFADLAREARLRGGGIQAVT